MNYYQLFISRSECILWRLETWPIWILKRSVQIWSGIWLLLKSNPQLVTQRTRGYRSKCLELFGYPAINGSHNPEFLIRIYITKQLCYCTDMIKCMKSLKSLSCLRLGLKLQNPCFGSCFFHQSRSLLSDLWSKTRSHFTKNQYFFNPSKNLVRP